MRICRFVLSGTVAFGVLGGEPGAEPSTVTPLAGHPFGSLETVGAAIALADVRLLAPTLPSKVIGIGKNYADHIAEMAPVTGGGIPAEPVMFLKPSTSVLGPREAIAYPDQSHEVHHEAELAVVIGRLCRDVPAARAAEVILGYTCANDVTARDLQRADGQWARAKGFDTFCPLGPWVETELDVTDLAIECTVNGEARQQGRTSDLLRSVPELIAHVSAAMTLLPGDVILTGTPAGVGPLDPGDEVSVSIEGIGTLSNRVERRSVFAAHLAASGA